MMSLISFFAAMTLLTVYFIPSMVALSRRHVNAMPIFLTNLYLGFTFLGWVGALIWSFSATSVSESKAAPKTPQAPRSYKPANPVIVKALKYTGAALGLLFVLVVGIFLLANAGGGGKDNQAATGIPMSADDMFKSVQPAPAGK